MNPIKYAKDFLSRRRTAYVKAFLNPYGQEVLQDLAKICRANQTTFHSDARVHAVAEGRREVWLRISQHLSLTDDDLWRIYGSPSQNVPHKE